ncbi:MAG: hypothetical protein ACLVL7_09560 [Anaerotruncus massiliensis (ex Togo et al. 2019)]
MNAAKDIDTALSQRRSTASSWLRPGSATPKNTAKSEEVTDDDLKA